MPTAPSSDLSELEMSLKDILSRIPSLGPLYRNTFTEPALNESLRLIAEPGGYWTLRIDGSRVYTDRAELVDMIQDWRRRFPTLLKWRVVEATRAWGRSIITFANVPVPPNELDEATLRGFTARFVVGDDFKTKSPLVLGDVLRPMGGSFSGHESLISPIAEVYVSEYALQYLGMYLLSSLVRYRPQTWVHAITRSVTSQNPADDHALALLEEFMGLHSRMIPQLVAEVLSPTE